MLISRGQEIGLDADLEDVGEKKYTGILPGDQPVEVTQYEKPQGQDQTPPEITRSSPPPVRESTAENPGTIDDSVTHNQIDISPESFVPSLVTAQSTGSIALAWEPVQGAIGYQVQ